MYRETLKDVQRRVLLGLCGLTYLLGHSVEEVAVSALLLPCPHEARLLSTRRSGAELHGAFACPLAVRPAANDANTTQTTTTNAAASSTAAGAVTARGDARANASSVRGCFNLRWPGRLGVFTGLWWDSVAFTASHIQVFLRGLDTERGRAAAKEERKEKSQ